MYSKPQCQHWHEWNKVNFSWDLSFHQAGRRYKSPLRKPTLSLWTSCEINNRTKPRDNIFISIYLDSVIIIAVVWLEKPSGVDLWSVDLQTPQWRSSPEQKTPVRAAGFSHWRPSGISDLLFRSDLKVSRMMHDFISCWLWLIRSLWLKGNKNKGSYPKLPVCISETLLSLAPHNRSFAFIRIHRALIK